MHIALGAGWQAGRSLRAFLITQRWSGVKRFGVIPAVVSAGFGLCGQLAAQSFPSTAVTLTHPRVIREVKHDETETPVREIPVLPRVTVHRPESLHLIKAAPPHSGPDLALQATAGPSLTAVPGLNFEGVGAGRPLASVGDPPDTNLSVGDKQVVEIVNFEYAVFDKSNGNLLHGPADIVTVWTGFGGPCESFGRGDPVVLFDKAAQRWVIAQEAGSGSEPDTECVAVSQTSDATGGYYRYAFPLGKVDYVKLGVWPDAYYLMNNNANGSGQAPQVCALDRTRMLAGASATAQCFLPNGIYGILLPSDWDGSLPPPPGSPNYFVGLDRQSFALDLFRFHADFTNPSNSTLTGPARIAVQPYTSLSQSIPEPAVGYVLEALSGVVMYRLAYRNFGDHESLVVNHTVDAGNGVAGIRWYEIRGPGSAAPTLFQQGTFSPDSNHRWMGSAAMDHAGDIALGYSISSVTMYPSIAYTGRVPTDPPGTMEGESILMNGSGSQTGSSSFIRWGDYTSLSIDPVDDCTFWYANEYLTQTGPPPVRTRLGSFRFPSCGSKINNLVSLNATGVNYFASANGASCPGGEFRIAARLTNTSAQPLSNLSVEVTTLTNGNLLENADGGPGGVGARLTIPRTGAYSDGILAPGESVDVVFLICLQNRNRFSFFVDLLGVVSN